MMKPTGGPGIKEGSSRDGMTMIELIIVVVLLAITAAIAVPNYQAYLTKHRLNGAARVVMTDLMHARSMATTENAPFKVVFSSSGYTISRIETDNTETQMMNRTLNNDYPEVSLTSNQDFIFRPNGTVNASGTTTLSNPKGVRKIVVSMAGRVRIE